MSKGANRSAYFQLSNPLDQLPPSQTGVLLCQDDPMAFSSCVRPPSGWVHATEVQARGTVLKVSRVSHSLTLWVFPRLRLDVSAWYLGSGLQGVPPLVPVSPISPSSGSHAALCLKTILCHQLLPTAPPQASHHPLLSGILPAGCPPPPACRDTQGGLILTGRSDLAASLFKS